MRGSGNASRSALKILLRSFPTGFRSEFGDEMLEVLIRDLDSARTRGPGQVAWFWVRTTWNTVVHGCLERLPRWRPGRAMPTTEIGREFRFAVRRLTRRPVFAATAIVTLALGIGATTALFSVVNGVLLRPLPYADAERLVFVGHQSTSDLLGMPSGGFLHYSEQSRTLDQLALYIETSAPVAGVDRPLELGTIMASPTLLSTLGVTPSMGRGFAPEDHEPGANPVALVTHRYWTTHLGADPAAVGRPVTPGSNQMVIGVLPAGFSFERPEPLVIFGNRFDVPDVFVPLTVPNAANSRFGNFMYQSLGRLAPGATAEGAERELAELMVQAAEVYPGGLTAAALRESDFRPVVMPVEDYLVREVSSVLWILLGAVFLVLAIAVANVTNLFLVRADARQSELAVRRALGASRGSVTWAFLSESVVVSLLGGALGVVLAAVATRVLLSTAPSSIPHLDGVGVNATVLVFAMGLAGVSAVGAGLAPLFQHRQRSVRTALGDEGRGGTATRQRHHGRRTLLVGQVALAAMLLIGSTLLVRTFQNLKSVDPGFDAAETATMRLSLSRSILTAAGRTEAAADMARSRFMLDVVNQLEQVPGVEIASFSADLPLDGDVWHDHVATGENVPTRIEDAPRAARVFIGPDYFAAIGARVVEGRELARSDFAEQPRALLVNQTFAERHWPGQSAVGRRVAQYGPSTDMTGDVWYTVIGVVEDIREASLMEPAEPTIYLPTVFLPAGNFTMWISNMVAVARVRDDAVAMLPRLREAVQQYRPDVPVNRETTLAHLVSDSFREVRFATSLITIAAVVALMLGAIGIYGAVSYVVGQRTREFGVRMALGATAAEVRRLVLRQGGMVGAAGAILGVVATLFAGRILESMLFGVDSVEPSLYLGVAVGVMAVVLLSALIPAHRAGRIDPLQALRAE